MLMYVFSTAVLYLLLNFFRLKWIAHPLPHLLTSPLSPSALDGESVCPPALQTSFQGLQLISPICHSPTVSNVYIIMMLSWINIQTPSHICHPHSSQNTPTLPFLSLLRQKLMKQVSTEFTLPAPVYITMKIPSKVLPML